MRRRILSLLLAFAMVLGMVPMFSLEAAADEPASVTVYLSMSHDDKFMVGEGSGKKMVMVPVTVPYFDLADYGLEEYYFSSEHYESDGSGGAGSVIEPGTSETAKDKVTLLHLYIYATEVFYCGAEGGSGYLKDEIGTSALTLQGGAGSSYITQLWGGDCNLQYYVNYEYPLASEGHGATADQILLRNGDIVTLGHFSSWNFYNDPATVFNYITAPKTTVTQGETLELSVMRAGRDLTGMSSNTAQTAVTSCPALYYCEAGNVPNEDVTAWNELGTAEADGSYTLNTSSLAPGEYMVAIPGQPGEYYPDEIVSSPGGMLLTVEAPEGDGEQDSGSNNQPSSNTLKGDTNRNGTVDVTMTISDGVDDFYDTPEQNKRLLVQEMNVPYFDLALYDLERYYYNPDCYTGTSQQVGTAQTAKNVVTTMHAMIWATEVYVLGFEPKDAGKGYRNDYVQEDLYQYINFDMDGGVGSTFLRFWHGSTNINYYLDYAFPLGREGWGSTSDQQALADGTAINIHLISSGSSASGSNYSFFEDADGQRDRKTITQGDSLTLTLKRTYTNYGQATPTGIRPNTNVYYIAKNAYDGEKVSQWTNAGKTDAEGKITLPVDLEPGTYYVSCEGLDADFQLAPAAFVLKVTKQLDDILLGDVNDDDTVDSLDAVLVLRSAVGTLGSVEITASAADVDGEDGITSLDAVLILKKAVGLIDKFPIE